MGISGDPSSLLHLPKIQEEKIPVIRRFSGGGTVIVDEDTLFISFIFQKKDLNIAPFPESILRWSTDLYKTSWEIPEFQLKENDYCIGDKKCGGNAQYIRKDRWIHHTSFLWDYKKENMEALLLPPKRPTYRLDRNHDDFLCCLKTHGNTMDHLIHQLHRELVKRFYMEETDLSSSIFTPHRRSTEILQFDH